MSTLPPTDQASGIRKVPRIRSIEGLRGILAMWVLFSHTVTAAGLGETWRGPFRVIYVGTHAVDAFIIVSGFVILYLLDTAKESYGRFLWRRALRLYPVYLICLVVSVLLLPLAVQVYSSTPWPHPHNDYIAAISQASIDNLRQHLLTHLTMVHGAVPDSVLKHANYAIITQGWSLSLEWQFYVIAPLVLWLLQRSQMSAIAVIGIACAAHFLLGGNEGYLPRHIPMFAIGIACFFLWRSRAWPEWPILLPTGLALAYLVTHDPAVVVWSAVFLAVLLPAAPGAALVNAVLLSPPLQALGRWSYSVYLSHTIVLLLAMAALQGQVAPAIGQWGYFALLLAVTVAGTVVVAAMLYRLVEAPCIAFGRRARVGAPAAEGMARS